MNTQSHSSFLPRPLFFKVLTEIFKYVTFCILLLFICAATTRAQDKQDLAIRKVFTFLRASDELNNYSKNGFGSKFTGKMFPVPLNIQTDLSKNLPEYKFYVAEMNVWIDLPDKKYKLILITQADTMEVKGFVWENYWTLPTSKSFSNILKGIKTKSNRDAIDRIKSFANLLAFTSNDKVGKANVQNKKVKVEMIRGEGVFAILEARLDNSWQFDRLNITEPDGRKLKIFTTG